MPTEVAPHRYVRIIKRRFAQNAKKPYKRERIALTISRPIVYSGECGWYRRIHIWVVEDEVGHHFTEAAVS